ncbi:hypothetical protein SMC26_31575 [Actinomadura fulvescens]|uniref:hypothetical protein n=1 Tax=Actinomadura fulvescens TaxID=46160 RepID=UPI0031D5F184
MWAAFDRERIGVEHVTEQAALANYIASLNGPGRCSLQRALSKTHGIDSRKAKKIISTVEQT